MTIMIVAAAFAAALVFQPIPASAAKTVTGILRRQTQELFDALIPGNSAVREKYLDADVRYGDENYYGAKLHCQYRSTDTWFKTAEGWRLIADQTLALRTDPPAVSTSASQRAEYSGRYELSPDVTYEIRLKGDSLEGRQSGHKAEELRAEAPDVLFSPGKPRYRMIFQRDSRGRVTGFAERREAWDIVWKRAP